MQETLYTLKAGTEVAPQFDGVVIPIQVPSSWAECLAVAGTEQAAVAIFNQAHKLNVQKAVKAETFEEGQTVEGLRAIASGHKYGAVRVRTGTGSGAARVKPATITTAVGDDFISSLTPEQKAMWDAKMAALSTKPAAANGAATPASTESGKGSAQPATQGKKK